MIAVGLGVPAGFIPRARAVLAPFVAAISLIPPITILPILFIVFGLGETSKIDADRHRDGAGDGALSGAGGRPKSRRSRSSRR